MNSIYGFPYEPFPSQQRMMKEIYACLKDGQRGLFESPTGTGKSLVLLSSVSQWLNDYPESAPNGGLQSASSSPAPKWVLDSLRDSMAATVKNDREARKQWLLQHARLNPLPAASRTLQPCDVPDDSDCISDYEKVSIDEDESEETVDSELPRAIICSRTHSQLSQLAGEFARTEWAGRLVAVPVASRSILCIHERVRGQPGVDEVCRCLREGRRIRGIGSRCPFYNKDAIEAASNAILALSGPARGQCRPGTRPPAERTTLVPDIEEAMRIGESACACPYYACRRAVERADIVFAPYQVLMSSSGRTLLGIEPQIDIRPVATQEPVLDGWGCDLPPQTPVAVPVTPHVIVLDEAHNLSTLLLESTSAQVTAAECGATLMALRVYKKRYKQRLLPTTLTRIKEFKGILRTFQSEARRGAPVGQGDWIGELRHLPDFLVSTRLSSNFQELRLWLEKARLRVKLGSFAQREWAGGDTDMKPGAVQSVFSFFDIFVASLVDSSAVVVNQRTNGDCVLRLASTQPGQEFVRVGQRALSVVGVGGTLTPAQELSQMLFGHTVNVRTYPHLAPDSAHLTLSVRDLGAFTLTRRSNDAVRDSFSSAVQDVADAVNRAGGGGVVLFLPSWSSLSVMEPSLRASVSFLLFVEPRQAAQVQDVLDQMEEAVAAGTAVLVAIIGGRLSEGINFRDKMCRAVLIAGIPFPNPCDPIIREREKQLPNYATTCALRAVNQAAGRCIRHFRDFAAICLLDSRFTTPDVSQYLSEWYAHDAIVVGQTDLSDRINSFLQRCTSWPPAGTARLPL